MSELNQAIVAAHYAHYTDATPLGLIDPDEAPNGNIIHHLYADGTITFQKGGSAYLQRSEFETCGVLSGHQMLGLKLVKTCADEHTYAILTEEECFYFRKQMEAAIAKMKSIATCETD